MSRVTTKNYYLQAFHKIETQDKNTWNWAAFFLGQTWMLFRKMYLYSFLIMTADTVLYMYLRSITNFSTDETQRPLSAIFVMFLYIALTRIIFGAYGNRIYYRLVKSRIRSGYHLLKEYRPTTISAALLSFFFPLFIFVIGGIYKMADYINFTSSISSNSSKSFEVNEESISAYLTPSYHDGTANNIAKCIAILLTLLFPFLIKYTVQSTISSQYQKIQQNIMNQSNY